jgi:carbamate kinase
VRVVAALGGNALLRRGQPLTADNQRENVAVAARALLPIALEHDLVLTHGNGPQVGLLALQNAAYRPDETYPLDILDAESEGMIGYLLEQELGNLLPGRRLATLLTRIEVARDDPAFVHPTKPIGPVYEREEAERLAAERDWTIAPDGPKWRRVVPSPDPRRILELPVIERLVEDGTLVICAGGGGIPVVAGHGGYGGVEAVIDKDFAGALLARSLHADAFLMLTDVDAAYTGWGTPEAAPIRRIAPGDLDPKVFAAGSMGPKVAAAKRFAEADGGFAVIGQLADAERMLAGEAGTLVAAAHHPIWGSGTRPPAAVG